MNKEFTIFQSSGFIASLYLQERVKGSLLHAGVFFGIQCQPTERDVQKYND